MLRNKTNEGIKQQSFDISYWRSCLNVVEAEALKQRRSFFNSPFTYFSMFIWPILQLFTAYYTYKPFIHVPMFSQNWPSASGTPNIFLFVSTGMMGYIFFWSLVRSAWVFSWERYEGTLEVLFLTPVNRLLFVSANGIMALIQNVWLFSIFLVGLIVFTGDLHLAHPLMLIVAFFALLMPAMAWGALLNSIFIFARDTNIFYTLIEQPLSFFTGVNIPTSALPFWARLISFVFPLTTSLVILRGILFESAGLATLWFQLLILLLFSVFLWIIAAFVLRQGEKHALQTGSLTLF